MTFGLVVALMLIASGVFRLWLIRSGKFPQMLGVQQYFPYVFIGAGVLLAIVTLVTG